MRAVGLQFSPSQNRGENGTDTNGTEVTSEESFTPCFHVRYNRFQQKHDWYTTEEDDQYCNHHQAPGYETEVGVVEVLPWDDGPKVNEVCQVEEQINDVGDVRLLRLLREPTIVTESDTAGESNQQVIHTQETSSSGTEDGQHKVEH